MVVIHFFLSLIPLHRTCALIDDYFELHPSFGILKVTFLQILHILYKSYVFTNYKRFGQTNLWAVPLKTISRNG
jgi:hypothetical protein